MIINYIQVRYSWTTYKLDNHELVELTYNRLCVYWLVVCIWPFRLTTSYPFTINRRINFRALFIVMHGCQCFKVFNLLHLNFWCYLKHLLSKFYDILPNIEKNCAILLNGYDILNAKYILVAIIIAFSIIE